MKRLLLLILLFAWTQGTQGALVRAGTERLLRSTYKLEGAGGAGTAFLLLKPLRSNTNAAAFVLVTAAHVLEGIQGDQAVLGVRRYDQTNYVKDGFSLAIRTNGIGMWVRHPTADVAAMRIPFRKDVDMSGVWVSELADDAFLKDFEISPGDELRVIGYPLSFEGNAGFGIVRSGRIASFPLVPSKKMGTYLLDFPVFPGNSGGPVFLAETRHVEDGNPMTVNLFRLCGLVSQELSKPEAVASMTETTIKQHKLGLAVVVHAELILETIDMLRID